MLLHYIKIAFRNLWKYKTQSIISIVGLAVGLTCFALATLWMHYEMTYDSFHKNAKDIYSIVLPSSLGATGLTKQVPYPFAAYLKNTFPEVKEAVNYFVIPVTIDSDSHKGKFLFTDSVFLKIFDIHLLDGHFPVFSSDKQDKNEIVITEEKARMLFGNENPVGKTIKLYSDYVITGVVSGYSHHSNIPFDFIGLINRNEQWNHTNSEGLLMLHPEADAEAFKQKLKDHQISEGGKEFSVFWTNTTLIPLTELHYNDPLHEQTIKFDHIRLFVLIGVLVILCALFNYITLFITRFQIGQKEFALRLLCGGSRNSLISLLLVEYSISLIIASLLGLFLVKILLIPFQELSEIHTEIFGIYLELFLYFLLLLFLSLIVLGIVIYLFGNRSLLISIQKRNRQIFRKASVIIQLIITIGMIFCTLVMIKQVYHLYNSENIGFEFKNRASIYLYGEEFVTLKDRLEQIPEIKEVMVGYLPILPLRGAAGSGFTDWEDKPIDKKSINLEQFTLSDKYIRFYNIRILGGEVILEDDPSENVMINESAVNEFGWNQPVGKTFGYSRSPYRVKGVVKNIYNRSSFIEVKSFYYDSPNKSVFQYANSFIFKFQENSWDVVQKKIKLILEEYKTPSQVQISSTEEEYDKLFKSESTLILILNFVSGVCILISMFGFFSLVSLNLEERRKEMTVRKINGATAGNIIVMYFKEYFLLPLISSMIAFPVSYFIMKHWLEQYIQQTEINAWIYFVILFAVAVIICLCVGWRIWRSSKENPVESLKRE
jgi:ABC-type transport system, involved in lipoprotein release, permease component